VRRSPPQSNNPTGTSRIISRVESPFVGEDYALSADKQTEYRAKLSELFAALASKEALFDPFLANSDAGGFGVGDDAHLTENKYFRSVSYAELISLLNASGERFVLFGGTRSISTAAVYNGVQNAAARAGYSEPIYVYDPVITSFRGAPNTRGNEIAADASDSGTHALLYANLIENYFPGFVSRWNSPTSGAQNVFGTTGAEKKLIINGKTYEAIADSALILYNKDVGIVDSFESELTWATGAYATGGTGNVAADGTVVSATFAYTYLNDILDDLFLKVGVSEVFLAASYGFSSDTSQNARRTVLAAESENSRLKLFTYYNLYDAAAALEALSGVRATVVPLSELTFYVVYTDFTLAADILQAALDGSAYTDGVDLTKVPESAESAAPVGGGATVPVKPVVPGDDC
jgi:hypothetical protein